MLVDMVALNWLSKPGTGYTNAKNKYNNYGLSFGVTYNFIQKFTVAGNINYNNIKTNANKDVFGFNIAQNGSRISYKFVPHSKKYRF